jgi:uncharacterized protein (DUF362 family)
MSKVVLLRCDSYDDLIVYDVLSRGLDLLGSASTFVREREKIVLKPNVLFGANPDRHITTHPSIFRNVVKLVQDSGAKTFMVIHLVMVLVNII